MTIEETRAHAVSKLGELSQIKKPTYSARDLHSRRPMLSRVQRQADKVYKEKVTMQKAKLTKDISDIDRYLQSVEDYDIYLAGLKKSKKNKEVKIMGIQSVPTVLPMPNVVIGAGPILKRTRLHQYNRRGKY